MLQAVLSNQSKRLVFEMEILERQAHQVESGEYFVGNWFDFGIRPSV